MHTDGYQASRINIWRDFFPPDLLDKIMGRQAGERIEVRLKDGDILPPFDSQSLVQVKRDKFEKELELKAMATPGVGRFYPKGMLKGVSGVFSANIQPCRCVEMVKNTYGRFLEDDMQVLDLMSSWQSHLPESLNLSRVVGLGLNENELRKNSQLTETVVQDLNLNSKLPYESNSFDAVICSVSVEYLVDPLAVFAEVARILRPDGYFILTFSNRWFPTKAIKIWKELHEFERMGLVLEYFIRSGGFENLQTYSIRGLPRPHDDKYFPDIWYSDPIYAVWGQKSKLN
jgi:SAM-dependent methyltransferase